MPKRIQLKRARGWRMPANAKKVDRTTWFGNAFTVDETRSVAQAVDLFRRLLANELSGGDAAILRDQILDRIETLRGFDLACWCALDSPCHADVLLVWANRPVEKNDEKLEKS